MKLLLWIPVLLCACGGQESKGKRTQYGNESVSGEGVTQNSEAEANALANFFSRPTQAPVATVASGKIQGVMKGKVASYLGIPYAKPPVGNLRFARPEPAENWTGTLEATKFSAQCPQIEDDDVGSEDCLYLNVFAPPLNPLAREAPKPVMVFIHGGAFDNGSSEGPSKENDLYSGEKLAALGNTIVVSMNYRLGALGFLAHPALSELENATGNNGILDQIMALEWVQKNIGSFGGDPQNVTVFGESAGAMSICTHVAQSYRRGLFKRAIMESGNCQVKPLDRQQKMSIDIAEKLGCKGDSKSIAACLRQKTAKQFVDIQTNLNLKLYTEDASYELAFGPVIDGVLFNKRPIEIIKEGEAQKIDMIIGANRYEIPGIIFGTVKSEPELVSYLNASGFEDSEIDSLKGLYPLAEYGSHANIAGAIATDVQFTCPKIELTNAMSIAGQKIRNYRYDLLLAFHGTELPYLFQKAGVGSVNMVEMGQLWTSFARNGTAKAGNFNWNPSTVASEGVDLVINNSPLAHINNYRQSQCELILNSAATIQ